MKTLREFWSGFFFEHEKILAQNYPGIVLERFLLEVKDILKLQTKNFTLDLSLSSTQISSQVAEELGGKFLSGKPFPYLLGESEFYGRKFHVSPDVLIPRPETELLVDLIVQNKRKYQTMADVGVGSGVILLSLLAEGVVRRGEGLDISEKAIEVARLNASNLRVENVEFYLSDRLQNAQGTYDLIVSNPPYIKTNAHRHGVHFQVDQHEPALALYIPDAVYEEWFKNFFIQVEGKLQAGGEFYMEGHEEELQMQAGWLREAGLQDVEVIKDWTKRERFLFGRKV